MENEILILSKKQKKKIYDAKRYQIKQQSQPTYTKVCTVCNSTFTSNKSYKKTCSLKCSKIYQFTRRFQPRANFYAEQKSWISNQMQDDIKRHNEIIKIKGHSKNRELINELVRIRQRNPKGTFSK